jgi:hypothetical protein
MRSGLRVLFFILCLLVFFQHAEMVRAEANRSIPSEILPADAETCADSGDSLCQGEDLPVAMVPDLETLPPYNLRLFHGQGSRYRILRFSNSIVNNGPGVLEVRGEFDRQNNQIEVSQYMYSPDDMVVYENVGAFEFHDEHNHWHWLGFSIYEILKVGQTGHLGEVVVSSDKVSYCMMDTDRAPVERLQSVGLANEDVANQPHYTQCGWRLQGISVGWIDTYAWNIPGQVLDISHLPDGVYALRSTVDPGGILFEGNIDNNSALVYFSLQGTNLEVIDFVIPATGEPLEVEFQKRNPFPAHSLK